MSLSALQRRILGYFRQHPNACDDAEGVARWRLLEDVVRLRLRETQRALDGLVARRVLARRAIPGAAPTYCLAAPGQTGPARRGGACPANARPRRPAAGRTPARRRQEEP